MPGSSTVGYLPLPSSIRTLKSNFFVDPPGSPHSSGCGPLVPGPFPSQAGMSNVLFEKGERSPKSILTLSERKFSNVSVPLSPLCGFCQTSLTHFFGLFLRPPPS